MQFDGYGGGILLNMEADELGQGLPGAMLQLELLCFLANESCPDGAGRPSLD